MLPDYSSDLDSSHPHSDGTAARVNAPTQVTLPSHSTAAAAASAITTAAAAAAPAPAPVTYAGNVQSTTGSAYNPVTEVLSDTGLRWVIAEFLPERAPRPPQNLVRRSPRLAQHRGNFLFYQICVHRLHREITFSIPVYTTSPPRPLLNTIVGHGGNTFSVPISLLSPAERQRRYRSLRREYQGRLRRLQQDVRNITDRNVEKKVLIYRVCEMETARCLLLRMKDKNIYPHFLTLLPFLLFRVAPIEAVLLSGFASGRHSLCHLQCAAACGADVEEGMSTTTIIATRLKYCCCCCCCCRGG